MFSKNYVVALSISIALYLIFFYKVLFGHYLFSGNDAFNYHYPSRYYLESSLKKAEFPLYTKNIYFGFPIAFDLERGYFNPVVLIFTYFFGFVDSLNLLHFLTYLVGSSALYFFLKKFGVSVVGFVVANLAYYFSFYNLFHLQHFGLLAASYLLPLWVLLLYDWIITRYLRFILFLVFLIFHLVTLGAYQMLVIYGILCVLMFMTFYKFKREDFKFLLLALWLIVILLLPILIPTYHLYTSSTRSQLSIHSNEGAFVPIMLINFLYPFFFGKDGGYVLNQIDSSFLIHESYIYVGISVLLLGIIGIIGSGNSHILKLFKIILFVCFVFTFLVNIPFDIPLLSFFRYWPRINILLVFILSLGLGLYISRHNVFDAVRQSPIKLLRFLIGFSIFFGIYTVLIPGGLDHFKYIGSFSSYLNSDTSIWLFVILLVIVSMVLGIYGKYRAAKAIALAGIFLDLLFFGMFIRDRYISPNTINPSDYCPSFTANKSAYVVDASSFGYNYNLYCDNNGLWGYSQLEPKHLRNQIPTDIVPSLKTSTINQCSFMHSTFASTGATHYYDGDAIQQLSAISPLEKINMIAEDTYYNLFFRGILISLSLIIYFAAYSILNKPWYMVYLNQWTIFRSSSKR